MAAELFSSMYLQAGIGGARNRDLLYHRSEIKFKPGNFHQLNAIALDFLRDPWLLEWIHI